MALLVISATTRIAVVSVLGCSRLNFADKLFADLRHLLEMFLLLGGLLAGFSLFQGFSLLFGEENGLW